MSRRVEEKERADPLYPFRSRVELEIFYKQIEIRTIRFLAPVLVVNFDRDMCVCVYIYIIDEQMTISLDRGLNLSSYFTLQLGCFPRFVHVRVCLRFLTGVESAGLVEMVIP